MRSGGRYESTGAGKRPRLVERTQHHPEGDHPRDADGKRLNAPPASSEGRGKKGSK